MDNPAKKRKTEAHVVEESEAISNIQVNSELINKPVKDLDDPITQLINKPVKDLDDPIKQASPKVDNKIVKDSQNISIPHLSDNAEHPSMDSDQPYGVEPLVEDSDQTLDVNFPVQDLSQPGSDSLSVEDAQNIPTPSPSQDANPTVGDSETKVTFSTISLQAEADKLIKNHCKEPFEVKIHYKGRDLYVYCSPCDTDLKMGSGRTRLLNFKAHLKNDVHKAIGGGIKEILERNNSLELREGLNKSIYCRACSSEIKGRDPATLISNVQQHLKGKNHGLKVKNLPPPITSMFKKASALSE